MDMRFHRRTVLLAACVAGVATVGVSAAFAAGTHAGRAHATTLTAGVLHAFTGQNAFFGQNAEIACKAAAEQINAAGGIMGNTLNCSVYDTKGDPADAVPVTSRMLASASHLVMVVGPDGNDIPAVLPLITQAKVPEMNTVGDPRYDHQTSMYFWRLTPSDSTQGPALAYYAAKKGYKKAVEVFTSDLSAQTTVTPFESKYKKMGGKIALKLRIAPDQASYQTEVSKAIAAGAQALIGEMDARTSATFLSELQQQNSTLLPFIVTQRALQSDWAPAVAPAVGPANLASSTTAIAPDLPLSGPAYAAFKGAMKSQKANGFQMANAFVAAQYDGVIVFALAMDMAKTTSSSYVTDIAKVTSAKPGAVVVHTYKAGLAALNAGKKIQYVGASGSLAFDKYNTANREYTASVYSPATKAWKTVAKIPLSQTTP
jgi:branched-chain amino acid transport system substrate-binding protein